jgi:hypothetical protein
MASRNFRPAETQSTNIVGGLVLLALVGLIVMIVQICRAWRTEKNRQWAVAWMKPGSAEPGHQIKLNGHIVGAVVEVGFPELRLRIDVSSPTDPTKLDGTHLGPGERARLTGRTGPIDLRLATPERLDVSWRGGELAIQLIDSLGRWPVTGTGTAALESTREWRALAQCINRPPTRCLARGDRLAIDGVILRWHGTRPAVRVLTTLDRGGIADALRPRTGSRDSAEARTTTLVGIELRETGAFGIGKQGLKLVIPGRDPGLIGARPTIATRMEYRAPTSWIVSPDSQPAIELVTSESLDMESVLAMASYLSDPTLRNTPPRTRWEDIIESTRGTVGGAQDAIGSARTALQRVEALSSADGGNGMVSRLLFETPEQRRFREAIDGLPDLLDRLETLAGTAQIAVDSTGRSVRQLTARIDSTLVTIEPELVKVLQGARTLEDSLVALSKQLETTLESAKTKGKPVGIALLVKLLASTLLDIAKLGGLR